MDRSRHRHFLVALLATVLHRMQVEVRRVANRGWYMPGKDCCSSYGRSESETGPPNVQALVHLDARFLFTSIISGRGEMNATSKHL